MANENLKLYLKIDADLKDAKSQLDKFGNTLRQTASHNGFLGAGALITTKEFNQFANTLDSTTNKLGKTRAGVESISQQLARLENYSKKIGLGFVSIAGIANTLKTVDAYNNLNARIRLVSASNQQAAQTFQLVSQMSSQTGQSINATGELYTRMARSLSGATQTDLLRVTETINKASVVSGATAQEAQAAVIQLSQGLASGVLRGEEFNSVSEQMPRILEMLQKSLGKTRGELRKMAEDGKLTTEVVFAALKEGSAAIDAEFAQMPMTISRATAEISNAWMSFVGGANDAVGVTKIITSVMHLLAENIPLIATALIGFVTVLVGRYASGALLARQATIQLRNETIALAEAEFANAKSAVAVAQAEVARQRVGVGNTKQRIAAEEQLNIALAQQLATEKALMTAKGSKSLNQVSTMGSRLKSLGSGALGLLGGPWGAAITGITLAVGGLMSMYQTWQEKERQLQVERKQTIQTLEDQREKTEALIDANGRLKDSVSTKDAIGQQSDNSTVLAEDVKKIALLQQKLAELESQKQRVASAANAGDFSSTMSLVGINNQINQLKQQLDEVQPKFDALSSSQSKLSDELNARLNRAFEASIGDAKSLAQTYDTNLKSSINNLITQFSSAKSATDKFGAVMKSLPGVLNASGSGMDELQSQISTAEESLVTFEKEAEQTKTKLEKELVNATYSAVEQLQQFRDKVIQAAVAAGKAPEDIDKLTASMNNLVALQQQLDTAAENKKKADEAARQAKSAANSAQSYVEGLEKQAAAIGKTEAQVRRYELAEKNLTGALKARAEAALMALEAQEAAENALKASEIQAKFLHAMGNHEAGSLLEVRNEFATLRQELEQTGNVEGLNWLDKLIPVQELKVRTDAIKQQVDDLFSYRSQAEASIQAQVQGGLISEITGRQQLVALHAQVGERLEAILPALREMANIPGVAGENIRALLGQLEGQLAELKNTSSELSVVFNESLKTGLSTSIEGLAKGTMTLSDACKNLVKTIMDSLAQLAAQGLVNSLLGGGKDGGGGLLGGLLGSIASFFSGGVTAATGGYITGAGTSTSDSIPARLSNGEYVVKAASVQKYGVEFLHAINGGKLSAFSTGGLVSHPTLNFPDLSRSTSLPKLDQAASSPTLPERPVNIQQTLVLDSAEVLSKGVGTVAGSRAMMTFIRSNASTIKQILG